MGHGLPPIQAALDHGIRPSLSSDVNATSPGSLHHARGLHAVQRVMLLQRARGGEQNLPPLLTLSRRVENCHHRGRPVRRPREQGRHAHAGQRRPTSSCSRPTGSTSGRSTIRRTIVDAVEFQQRDTVFIAGNEVARQPRGRRCGAGAARGAGGARRGRPPLRLPDEPAGLRLACGSAGCQLGLRSRRASLARADLAAPASGSMILLVPSIRVPSGSAGWKPPCERSAAAPAARRPRNRNRSASARG